MVSKILFKIQIHLPSGHVLVVSCLTLLRLKVCRVIRICQQQFSPLMSIHLQTVIATIDLTSPTLLNNFISYNLVYFYSHKTLLKLKS